MGSLAISSFSMSRGWPAASTPNLEDQVIFHQCFLPLAAKERNLKLCHGPTNSGMSLTEISPFFKNIVLPKLQI